MKVLPGHRFRAKSQPVRSVPCIHATNSLYAGFHAPLFPAKIRIAQRFVERRAGFSSISIVEIITGDFFADLLQ
jgi:hypothetical protein